MRRGLRGWGWAAMLLVSGGAACAQTVPGSAAPVTIDVTVLDAAGHPLAEQPAGLDFKVLEDGKPVKVLRVEAPGAEPVRTAFVLDEVNDTGAGGQVDTLVFTDMARMRDALRGFLKKQPATLPGDVEVFALTRKGLERVAAPTRDRDAVLKLVGKRRPILPTASMLASENQGYGQALAVLRVLALENYGLPGRKNVVWMGVGPGGGRHAASGRSDAGAERTASRIHTLTALLLASRTTVSAVGAETEVPSDFQSPAGLAQYLARTQESHLEGDTSFRALTRATGGEFLDGNDVDGEMALAGAFGSRFFTLQYAPEAAANDGRFRRLQVTATAATGPLLALTRAGRYALDLGGGKNAPANAQEDLSAVVVAPVAVTGLHLQVARIVRYQGSDRAEFTVVLPAGELACHAVANAQESRCGVTLAVAALGAAGEVLESQLRALTVTAAAAGADGSKARTEVPLVAVVPKGTVSVRIALREDATGRVGTVDVTRAEVDKAPAGEAPKPALKERGK